jgi:hypothetical protein
MTGDVGDAVAGDAGPGDELGIVGVEDAVGDRVDEDFGELLGRVGLCGRRRGDVGDGGRDDSGYGAAQLAGGVEEDVGGDPARAALQGVGADPVVDGRDRGRGAFVAVAEGPPAAGQVAGARQQQLEQDPGGELVAGDGPGDEGQEHAVGVLRSGGAHVPLEVGERGDAGEGADVGEPAGRVAAAAEPGPFPVECVEDGRHGGDGAPATSPGCSPAEVGTPAGTSLA